MDNFRVKEKAKTTAKLEVINAILDDVQTLDLSKANIIALIEGYKTGLTSVLGWYEDKANEKTNSELLN